LIGHLNAANEWQRYRPEIRRSARLENTPGNPMKYVERAATIVFSVATVLVVAVLLSPFPIAFPAVSLETGWAMSMSEAVAEGLAIGRDISFTFGPYTAVYTHEYHPAVGTAMIVIPLLFGLSYAAGLLCLDIRRIRVGALAISCGIFLAGTAQEALFLSIPLLHLLVTDRITRPSRPTGALRRTTVKLWVLAALTLSLSFLPLVKGSFAIVTALLGACSFILMYRARTAIAFVGFAIFVLGLTGGWVASGQPIGALPDYFLSFLPIVAGYSDAMSIWKNEREVTVYCVAAAALFIPNALRIARDKDVSSILCGLGVAVTLFLLMKEGFVRHDSHALTGAAGLIVVGFLLVLQVPTWAGLMLACVAVLGWAQIASAYIPVAPGAVLTRAELMIGWITAGILDRIDNDQQARFEASMKTIRERYPLTNRHGTADLYPIDQELVLANGINWSPRPIIQSYSAYTHQLLVQNRNHLEAPDAPQYVYFGVSGIDGRFPTLDDSLSLIDLTTDYRYLAMESGYAVLEKAPSASSASALSDVVSQGSFAFGQQISLPATHSPVWVEIELEPSLLGRLVNTLFKLPNIFLHASFVDGRKTDYRYIAGIGSSGFMISPVIADTDQFVSFLSPHRDDLLADRTLAAFSLSADSWAKKWEKWFWKPAISVRFRRFDPPTQPAADVRSLTSWLTTPPAGYSADMSSVGTCLIDNLRPLAIRDTASSSGRSILQSTGWAVYSTSDGIAPDEIFLVITDETGPPRFAKVGQVRREDVNIHFKRPDMGAVGFSAMLERPDYGKGATLRIAQSSKGELHFCPVITPLPVVPSAP
jgi:hypothetical protein